MMWDAEEMKIPYIPAVIMEWEITTVDTLKMLVSFAEVSYEFVAPCCPTPVLMTQYAQLDYFNLLLISSELVYRMTLTCPLVLTYKLTNCSKPLNAAVLDTYGSVPDNALEV